MKITAIIPSLHKADGEYLDVAIKSLRETTDWDIIVVTNGSKEKPTIAHGATLHLNTRDQGQCNTVNIGVQAASPDTDYIFISNADMYYAPGWNRKLDFWKPRDWPLCFSPNLVEPTNNKGSAKPFRKFDGGFTLEEFKKEKVDVYILDSVLEYMRNHSDETEKQEDGFNFPVFIDRQVWNRIGGYDIAYDPWGSNSDTDLQMKIELAGIMPQRVKDMLVYHFSNKSGTFEDSHQAFWQNNWDYLTEKWGFNRDDTKADTWYCKNMLDLEKLKYHPEWEGRYKNGRP